MKENSKIYVKDYLMSLNAKIDILVERHLLSKNSCTKLTCKSLAENCEVTCATISNLSTSSKFDLIYRVAKEIYNSYFSYFVFSEEYDKFVRDVEDDDFDVIPYDVYYIIQELIEYIPLPRYLSNK